MIDFHNVTAGVLVLMSLLAGRAYLPNLLADMTPPACSLAWGFVSFSAGSVGRVVYWSFPRLVLGDDWPRAAQALGGLNVNILFEVFMIVGVYLILRARYLAIPEEDRGDYNVFTCVTYPEPFRLAHILGRKKDAADK